MCPTNRLGQTSKFSKTQQHGPWNTGRRTAQCSPASHTHTLCRHSHVCTWRVAHMKRPSLPLKPWPWSVYTRKCSGPRKILKEKLPGPVTYACFGFYNCTHLQGLGAQRRDLSVTQALWKVCRTMFHREVTVVKRDRLACSHTSDPAWALHDSEPRRHPVRRGSELVAEVGRRGGREKGTHSSAVLPGTQLFLGHYVAISSS